MNASDKKFNAILAKNEILRHLKKENISYGAFMCIIECLKNIELVIGEGNQPSINDIINSDFV